MQSQAFLRNDSPLPYPFAFSNALFPVSQIHYSQSMNAYAYLITMPSSRKF